MHFLGPWVIAALGLALLPRCARAADPATDVPENVTMELAITPGKPGAPTERVVISRTKLEDTIRVERNSAGSANNPAETAVLPAGEYPALWKIVTGGKLLAFRPVPQPGVVFDFGKQSLVIDCLSPGSPAGEKSDGKSYNSASWESAIANESAVKPLFTAVTALARKHCKKVELVYFR